MNLEELQQQMDDCEIDGFGRNDKVTIDVFFKFMTSFINPEQEKDHSETGESQGSSGNVFSQASQEELLNTHELFDEFITNLESLAPSPLKLNYPKLIEDQILPPCQDFNNTSIDTLTNLNL